MHVLAETLATHASHAHCREDDERSTTGGDCYQYRSHLRAATTISYRRRWSDKFVCVRVDNPWHRATP